MICKERYAPPIASKVTLWKNNSMDKHYYENTVCDEMAEFLAGYLSGIDDYKITHIYGQWGLEADFPEGTGPFFTPSKSDIISDLETATIHTTDARVPIMYKSNFTELNQSRFDKNGLSALAFFTHNDGKIYVGAGLVCKTATKELLLGHVAFNGMKKESPFDIAMGWDWTFGN